MVIKRFLFIRHGMPQSNFEHRYISDPEEPLSFKGLKNIYEFKRNVFLPEVNHLISGTALRCHQTTQLLFPEMQYSLCQMKEIDFGIFKDKNADELINNKEYEKWLESNCMADIPGGNSVLKFKKECCDKFLEISEKATRGTTAFVIHGGNIMSILEHFALPEKFFYDYHMPNCGFFLCRYENGRLIIERSHP